MTKQRAEPAYLNIIKDIFMIYIILTRQRSHLSIIASVDVFEDELIQIRHCQPALELQPPLEQ